MAELVRGGRLIIDDRGNRHDCRVVKFKREAVKIGSRLNGLYVRGKRGTDFERGAILRLAVLHHESCPPEVHRAATLVTKVIMASGIASLFAFGLYFFVAGDFVLGASLIFFLSVVVGKLLMQHTVGYQRALGRNREAVKSLPPVCLACNYDLSGLEPEGDGCTVCPECGAAWRFPIRGPWGEGGQEGSNEP